MIEPKIETVYANQVIGVKEKQGPKHVFVNAEIQLLTLNEVRAHKHKLSYKGLKE